MNNKYLDQIIHDLKNPLSSILGLSDLLDKKCSATDQTSKEIIRRIHHHAIFSLKLVNDLLDLEFLNRKNFSIEKQPTDIEELAEKTINNHLLLAADRNIAIAKRIHKNFRLYLDSLRMEQILNNLLNNAIKYSPPGSKVVLHTDDYNGFFYFKITDNGPGLKKEDQIRIFEPFTKINHSSEEQCEGSGLGLSIVKKLVELMHGELFVESEENHGATFIIKLKMEAVE